MQKSNFRFLHYFLLWINAPFAEELEKKQEC